VTALARDSAGRLWIGTWQGAAVRTEAGWRVYDTAAGLLEDMVNVLLADSTGGVWFGSHVAPDGGISYLKDDKWQHFTTDSGLPHNNINAFLETAEGTVWVGTGMFDRGGAVQLVCEASGECVPTKVLTVDTGLPGANVRSLFLDSAGGLWIGTEYDGLAWLQSGRSPSPASFQLFNKEDGLSGREVKAMLEDVEGKLWLGTDNGITIIEEKARESMGSN
jgi:ligand-binding sensor domain-containing protein